ncbi:hypothetical protein WA1_51570 [Scytonema hofmannii PCC 7110]|uniref:Uncharacterized protein n=1 Tax=Scytonema hofmannii PCC 7110 TaxID=128403 RepID=A0A139WPY2_9CYAN|nr:hypothetical protein [Scytonema hofmannii]KYC34485.1 hypothetical protein WA1_51570 [Scytonema hofmannii PCC 7110]
MQDILNNLVLIIAIAFTALMAMDFIAGLVALTTSTPTPQPPTKKTLTEIMNRPEITPSDVQQQELDQLEELFVPTPKTQALGQLLLEEYNAENKQYWEQWHRTFDAVRANLRNFPKNSKVTVSTGFTTSNFPKIDTVNEMPVLSSFEGIDYETMLHTNWTTATPLSCDPCNFQFCPLPEPVVATTPKRKRGRPRKVA